MKLIFSSLLIFALNMAIFAQQNPAVAKLSAKIEKVVISQILKDLKESDYESYLLLSAMWQGIKNQSGAGIERSLQQLLVEKGFIYTLYSKGYRYTEPGLAYTVFSHDFFKWLERENPAYLEMVTDRYDYMISASEIAQKYFLTDSFFNIRTLLNDVKNENPQKNAGSGPMAEFMAENLITTNYIPFKNRASLEDKNKRTEFVGALKQYLEFNFAQRTAYKKFDKDGSHKNISVKLRNQINTISYDQWISKLASQNELKEIYLEVISYMIRVMLSGDQEFSLNARAGQFPILRKVLERNDSNLKIKGNSLNDIRYALVTRLRTMSRSGDRARYASVAAIYTLTNTLIEQSRLSVKLYQQSGSLFDALGQNNGKYFNRYMVVPWYRDFYREDWFGNEFIRHDDLYAEFFSSIRITALMTDYIINRDENRLVKNFQKFAWQSMHSAEKYKAAFRDELAQYIEYSQKAGLTPDDKAMVTTALDHLMGVTTLSELILLTKNHMTRQAKIDRYSPEAVRKFEQFLDKGALKNAPFMQAYYLKIVQAISAGGDLSGLEAELVKLQPNLIAEALSWHKYGAFAVFSYRFDYELPVMGTTIRSILSLLAANDAKSFRSTLLTTYNQSLDKSIHEMPEKTKAVSEPFLRSAMNSVVAGQKVGIEEYTNIAIQSMRGIERSNLWLHFSLGFSVAYFVSDNPNASASKVYINDMLGLDFIGMGYQLRNSGTRPWLGLGIFAGGVLDYMVSEAAKLDTRLLPGGNHYLKTGIFLNFRHPDNTFIHFSIQGGAAFSLSGEPVYFIASSWNVFDITDFL